MATVSLLVAINTEELNAELREEHTLALGRRLRELDEASLSTLAGANAPAGGKGVGNALVGGFAVTLAASRRPLATALDAIRSWAAAGTSRTVAVEIDGDQLEIDGASGPRTDRELDAFVAKHSDHTQSV